MFAILKWLCESLMRSLSSSSLSEMIIFAAETPLSVREARWKNAFWGFDSHSGSTAPAFLETAHHTMNKQEAGVYFLKHFYDHGALKFKEKQGKHAHTNLSSKNLFNAL